MLERIRHPRRLKLTAGLFGCALGLFAGLGAFAPAAQAGSGDPLVLSEGPPSYMVGGTREYLPFGFISKQSCDRSCRKRGGVKGSARIVMPPPQTETDPPHSEVFLGYGDGIETPQLEDSTKSGYVYVNKGSCERVSLESVKPLKSIDVDYRCKRGHSFLVTYVPRVDWWDLDGSGFEPDRWEFGLRHRDGPGERWRRLDERPVIEVGPTIIEQSNLVFEAPPAPLVETEVQTVGGEDSYYFTLEGRDEDSIKTSATLEVGSAPEAPSGFFTLDENGEPVPVTPDPDKIDALRSFDQPPLVVNDCSLPTGCHTSATFGEVEILAPPGVFTVGGVGVEGAHVWAVIVGSNFAQSSWDGARRDCLAAGGSYTDFNETTPDGQGEQDWRCDFDAALNLNKPGLTAIMRHWVGTIGNDTSQCQEEIFEGMVCAGFVNCAVGRIFGVANWPGGGGDDYIWCPQAHS